MEDLRAALNDEAKFDEMSQIAFNKADDNNSGAIDKSELSTCMRDFANEMKVAEPTNEEIESNFKFLDQDKNGVIDLNEFKVFTRMVLEEKLKKGF